LNSKKIKIVVFSDLDGSLLNNDYGYGEVAPAISRLRSLHIPIVFASSKTRSEIIFYRRKMRVSDPFIAENGSAIFIPKDYFQAEYSVSKQTLSYNVIELGTPYGDIRKKLGTAKAQAKAEIFGFGDMTEEKIAEDSGLPLNLARLAKKREYSEPFKILSGNEKKLLQAINNLGLSYTRGGRYLHASGKTDKGKAVAVLKHLFMQQFGEILTVAVGDSANDLAMLKIVDKPFFVGKASERKAVWTQIQRLAENQV
jgi:mannosyl-3-phosphoglycerate phosphatase